MRRRISLLTIVGLPATLLGLVGNLATGTVEVPATWKPWIWLVVVTLLGTVAMTEAQRAHADDRARTVGRAIALDEASTQLAESVSVLWRREEDQRRVQDPFALAVRWHLADDDMMDLWANILRLAPGALACPLDLAGQLAHIVPVFNQIPSRRLVILGRAGSGKTVLTIRFVLDLLERRQASDPVPMIFSVSSWDPTTMTLGAWLTHQIIRDHPGLAASADAAAVLGDPRSSLAASLVEAGRIIPVLDGFDEIPEGLHHLALAALNTTTLPLVLTSRPAQYRTAIATSGVLRAAAAIELDDLTMTDLAEYLPRTTRRTGGARTDTAWEPFFRWLEQHPASPHTRTVTTALSTPLMAALARAVTAAPPTTIHEKYSYKTTFPPSRPSRTNSSPRSYLPYSSNQPLTSGPPVTDTRNGTLTR